MKEGEEELLQRVRSLQLTTSRLAEEMMAGLYHAAFKGRGMEFEEVREYRPGDEVRHIDWNVTARLQHPYTKVFREEREITLWLLVDISPSMHYGSGSLLKRDYAAEVAAQLAFASVKNGDKVGLLLFSNCIEHIVAPAKGREHVMGLVEELIRHKATGTASDLDIALTRLMQLQKKHAICIAISDFLDLPDIPTLQRTAKSHDLIAIMVGDRSEQRFPLGGVVTMSDRENGGIYTYDALSSYAEMPLKRQWGKQTERLCQNKVEVIQLMSDKPSYRALRTFFKMRARRAPR